MSERFFRRAFLTLPLVQQRARLSVQSVLVHVRMSRRLCLVQNGTVPHRVAADLTADVLRHLRRDYLSPTNLTSGGLVSESVGLSDANYQNEKGQKTGQTKISSENYITRHAWNVSQSKIEAIASSLVTDISALEAFRRSPSEL